MADYLKTQACSWCFLFEKKVFLLFRILYMHPMKYVLEPVLTFLLQLLRIPPNYPLPNFISPLFFIIDKAVSPLMFPEI